MMQFLFGLLHKGRGKAVETTLGRKVSPGLREGLLKWTEREIKDKSSRLQIEPVDLFHCLSFQLCSLPVSQLHLLCQALRNPYCKIKDLRSDCLRFYSLATGKDSPIMGPYSHSSLHLHDASVFCRLIFCHLTASCGRDLSLVFETNQHLTDLEFVKNTLEDSGMKLLCEGLKQLNCVLQTLRLYRHLISSSCGALAAVLSTNQWLTELEFSETKLEASALKLLCEGLKDTNCKLQKLKLCASLLPEGSEAVCRYLACVLICNPHITELDPSENPLGDIGVKYLCVGLRHSNCKVEKLDLSTCHLTDASCVELSSFLQVSQALKELFVFANVLGDTGVQHLCEGLQHTKGIIENLVLSEYSLSAACCEPLAQVLSSTWRLTRLILINNKIEDMGLKLLCEGLKQPDCHLKDLV
ncbi:hypothetical protein H8959_000667 [Pygathrix nigripes]